MAEPESAFMALVNTMDPHFCVEALEEAVALYGAPEIFNTDQGSPNLHHVSSSLC